MFLLLDSEELSRSYSNMACILASMMQMLHNPLQGELLKDILYDKINQLSWFLESPFDKDVALLKTQAWEFSVQEQVFERQNVISVFLSIDTPTEIMPFMTSQRSMLSSRIKLIAYPEK